jgi:hypothetical protein
MTTNLAPAKEGQQKTWSTGNYARIGNPRSSWESCSARL